MVLLRIFTGSVSSQLSSEDCANDSVLRLLKTFQDSEPGESFNQGTWRHEFKNIEPQLFERCMTVIHRQSNHAHPKIPFDLKHQYG